MRIRRASSSPSTTTHSTARLRPPSSLSKDSKAVIVKLDGPRRVLSVSLAAPLRSVELHRADGPVQADKAADAASFTDVNFAVQFASPVAPNQVTAVNVRGVPANPRIAAAGTDLASPALFWPTPDAAGSLNVSAGPALGKALQSLLSAQHTEIAMVIQSDAPCRIAISNFKVPYHRVLTVFTPSSGAREVLRYSGKRVERQSLSVTLPFSANVVSGLLKIDESFRGGAAAAALSEIVETASSAALPDRGIRLSAERAIRAAQRVDVQQANTFAGLSVAVLALSPDVSLAVEVQSDYQNAPSGKKIAEASVAIARAGVSGWVIGSFAAPVALAGGPCWILMRALRGDAVWLAAPGAHAVETVDSADGGTAPSAGFDGLEALHRLVPQSAESPPPENGIPPAGHARILIGSVAAALGNGSFDVTAPLNAFLNAARTGPPAASTKIPIEFAAAASGLLTVYPPRIVYDVP